MPPVGPGPENTSSTSASAPAEGIPTAPELTPPAAPVAEAPAPAATESDPVSAPAAEMSKDMTDPNYAINKLRAAGTTRIPGSDDYPSPAERNERVSPAAGAQAEARYRTSNGLPPVGQPAVVNKGIWSSIKNRLHL